MNHGPASQESIQIEAYILSEIAGHPPGMEHIFWRQAEAIVHARLAAGLGKPAPRARTARAAKPAAAASGDGPIRNQAPRRTRAAAANTGAGEASATVQPAATRKRRS